MPEPVFQPNSAGLTQLYAAMALASREAMDRLWKVLSTWGVEYQTRIIAVIPRDDGTAARSIQLKRERTDTSMTVVVGTSQKGKDGQTPYPQFLEMGTRYIAGGRVLEWEPGKPPITSWPAKDALRVDRTGATPGRDEQMPFFRPIGYEIAPLIIDDCRDALNDTLKERLDGKKF